MLCSLPTHYDIFADTLLYGKNRISLDDDSIALNSEEFKKNFLYSKTEGEGLQSRGRI